MIEIKPEEICEIDSTQVTAMHLKDGTVVIVNSNVEEGNFTEEEFPAENVVVSASNTDNQLRARPMVGMPMAPRPVVPVRPVVAPVRPAVVPPPGRPVVVPKSITERTSC